MTTFSPGQHVRCFRDIGTVRRVLAGGYVYKVEFPGLGEVTCLGTALAEAPANVAPILKRKGSAPTLPPLRADNFLTEGNAT